MPNAVVRSGVRVRVRVRDTVDDELGQSVVGQPNHGLRVAALDGRCDRAARDPVHQLLAESSHLIALHCTTQMSALLIINTKKQTRNAQPECSARMASSSAK